jgi:hypothetical protein
MVTLNVERRVINRVKYAGKPRPNPVNIDAEISTGNSARKPSPVL